MNFCLADCAFHPNADLNASRLRTTVALYLITATAHPHHAHFAGQLRLRICAARSSEVCARFRFGFGRPHVAPRLSTSRKSRIGNCIRTGNCRSVRVGSTTALQRCRTARSRSYPAHGEATKSETSAQAPLSPNKTAKPCGKTSRCEVGRPCFWAIVRQRRLAGDRSGESSKKSKQEDRPKQKLNEIIRFNYSDGVERSGNMFSLMPNRHQQLIKSEEPS